MLPYFKKQNIKNNNNNNKIVTIDQNAFGVSYSRWRQQRLSRRRSRPELKEILSRYVKHNFRRNESLHFVSRDSSEYAWSLRALERRLEFFNGIT